MLQHCVFCDCRAMRCFLGAAAAATGKMRACHIGRIAAQRGPRAPSTPNDVSLKGGASTAALPHAASARPRGRSDVVIKLYGFILRIPAGDQNPRRRATRMRRPPQSPTYIVQIHSSIAMRCNARYDSRVFVHPARAPHPRTTRHHMEHILCTHAFLLHTQTHIYTYMYTACYHINTIHFSGRQRMYLRSVVAQTRDSMAKRW